MRIIVASPPKTGNVWIKSLLAEIYGLQVLTEGPTDDARSLQEHIQRGWFENNSIFHEHYWPTDLLFELAESVQAALVTSVRHPYDVFVSLYYYVQNFPELFAPEHPLYFMLGKPIEHPEILEFIKRIEGGFGIHIKLAREWVNSEGTILIRYETLRAEPLPVMKAVTEQITPVEEPTLLQAIKVCSAKNMRKKNKILSRHIRKGKSGDWRNHLTKAHLELFSSHYRDWIEEMGYEVYESIPKKELTWKFWA